MASDRGVGAPRVARGPLSCSLNYLKLHDWSLASTMQSLWGSAKSHVFGTLSGGDRDMTGVEEFRRQLREARERLLRTVASTDEELATLEAHPAGALSEDAAIVLAAGVLSRLEGQEKHALDEIDAAQARLEAGTFGVCERCSRPIALDRLRAMPTARYCIPCQSREEQ